MFNFNQVYFAHEVGLNDLSLVFVGNFPPTLSMKAPYCALNIVKKGENILDIEIIQSAQIVTWYHFL